MTDLEVVCIVGILYKEMETVKQWIYKDMLITIWNTSKWICKLKGTIVLFPEEMMVNNRCILGQLFIWLSSLCGI